MSKDNNKMIIFSLKN